MSFAAWACKIVGHSLVFQDKKRLVCSRCGLVVRDAWGAENEDEETNHTEEGARELDVR